MRRFCLVAVVVVLGACARSETPATDSAAAAAAPAALSPDMVAGTWTGVSMPAEGSDSVLARWTLTSDPTALGGKLVFEGSRDTVTFTSTFDADSMISTSSPYKSRIAAGAPEVVFRSVGRLVDGKLVGISTTTLVSKPDSVVTRTRFEATRVP